MGRRLARGGTVMIELFRYAAFISYSSKDAAFARRLHRALEGYRIPRSLGEFDLIGSGKPNRIYPIFRDREELSVGELGARIEAALKASAALIVVCSPSSAASTWVKREIEHFASLGRRDSIYAIVADGAPLADNTGADAIGACLPPTLRRDDAGADAPEPLAADARPGKDGFRNAWLKLVAGLASVTPGQLIDRDRERRRRQRTAIAVGASALAISLSLAGALVDAYNWRSDLTSHALDVESQGRSLDAVPFALAGLPARGDLVGASHANANAAVQRTGALVAWVDFGRDVEFGFSPDARFLLTRTRTAGALYNDPAGVLYDLREGGAPILLGRVAIYGFSSDGRFLVTEGPPDGAELRDLHEGGALTPLGRINEFGFSSSNRFLLTRDANGAMALRDLGAGGAPVPLGPGRAETHSGPSAPCRVDLISFCFSPDSSLLVTRDAQGEAALHDLHRGGRPRPLGRIDDYGGVGFSGDGDILVTRAPDGAGTLRVLHRGGTPTALGKLDTHRGLPADGLYFPSFLLSPDSRFLVTRTADGECWLYDLRQGGAPASLGRLHVLHGFDFSADGRFLVTVDQRWVGLLRDLHDGPTRPLGVVSSFRFSSDGRFLLTRSEGVGALHDLHADGAPLLLGRFHEYAFSPDGCRLLIVDQDGAAAVRDICSIGEPMRVGRIDPYTWSFSPDGRFVLTSDAESGANLYDLRQGGAAVSVGRFSARPLGGHRGSFAFSSDGRFLATNHADGAAALRDLAAPIARGRGARLRAEICGASGVALRPFPAALRMNQGSENASLYRRLRGRPWNPCDWRGLGAIFPDPKQGDGWFEGARQWLRLMHILYFRGEDWGCVDTTTRASAETHAARADMCMRFASRPQNAR